MPRTVLMRPAISRISSFQRANKTGSLMTVAAMRAPCTGGLLYMARAMRLSCESVFFAASASASTALIAPTRSAYRPRFLE